MRRLASWLPPLVWMAVIGGFSTDTFSAEHTGSILLPLLHWTLPWASSGQIDALHHLMRKAGHVTEYAVLAALWFRACVREGAGARRASWIALVVAVLWAAGDEWHQAFVPSRTSSPGDVVLDTVGAVLALVVARLGWRRATDRAVVLCLWIAAVGGAAILVLDFLTGASSGVLWLTVPVAGLVLLARWRSGYSRS